MGASARSVTYRSPLCGLGIAPGQPLRNSIFAMGLRVNTNIASLTAQRDLSIATERRQASFAPLASGLRIAVATDGSTERGIIERQCADIRSSSVAVRNAKEGLALLEACEEALNEVSDILGRLRELAAQAMNGAVSVADRGALNAEYRELVEEIDRISSTTQFNGVKLLDGSQESTSIQVGIDGDPSDMISVSTADVSSSSLRVDASITAAADATGILPTIDEAFENINRARGELGVQQHRLAGALRTLASTSDPAGAAEGLVREADAAIEAPDVARRSELQCAASSLLAESKAHVKLALSILG